MIPQNLIRPAIIVTHTSVLINFLRIDRIDLIADHSHAFLATDHVANEVSNRYPDQQRRFASSLDSGALTRKNHRGGRKRLLLMA